MSSPLRTLAHHSVVYGLGTIATTASGFLLIPLFTRWLTPAEYGLLELLNRAADVLILVGFVGVRQAYIRFHFDRSDDPDWANKVTGTTLVFGICSGLAPLALAWAFLEPASRLLPEALEPMLVWILLAWIPFEMLATIGLVSLQIHLRSRRFVAVSVIRLALALMLNVVFLTRFDWGIRGVLYAQLLSTAIVAVPFLVGLGLQTRFKVSPPILRGMLRFGLPYLPASVLMFVLTSADRYFLTGFDTLESVGLYSLASKLGLSASMLLLTPFLRIWSPFLFETFDRPDGPELVGRVLTLVTLVTAAYGVALTCAAPLVLRVVAGSAFRDSGGLLPLFSLAAILYAMHHVADAGILIAKRTDYKPAIAAGGAAACVFSQFLLVPPFGAPGAAVGNIVAFLVLLLLTHAAARRHFRITIERRRISLVFLAFFLSVTAATAFQEDLGMNITDLAVPLVALPIFPIVLLVGGFVNPEERALLMSLPAKVGAWLATRRDR